MKAVPFARLRVLRDIAGQLDASDLADALEELIHLRAARANTELPEIGTDRRIEPEDLRDIT